jgi:hypothetical protein
MRTPVPRHPSRYRISFTLGTLPLQQLFLDELPALARQPPRPREICISLAIAHHSSCTENTIPRTIVTSHITILGTATPVTTVPLKVCRHCLHSHEKISAELTNQMYATLNTPVSNQWTIVNIHTVPTFHSLPPIPCTRDHNPPCPHSHCQDATNCTCNPITTTPIGSTTTPAPCAHQHCPSSSHCTCTTQISCPDPADHLFSMDQPHPSCGAAHCPEPTRHLGTSDSSQNTSPCPDPSLHELNRPQPLSPRTIILSHWADQQMESFSVSVHSVTFSTSCNALHKTYISMIPYLHEFPNLDLNSYVLPRVQHGDVRGIHYVVLQLHSLELVRDRSLHLGHDCPILNCPLQVLAELQTGSATSANISFNDLLSRTRARMSQRLLQFERS